MIYSPFIAVKGLRVVLFLLAAAAAATTDKTADA